MAVRCSSASPSLFLPFLYPSVIARTVRVVSPRQPQLCRQQVRHHITESTPNHHHPPAQWTRLNPAPDDYAATVFADKADLTVFAGSGGHGCVSFLRDAYFADGPANGGDGGHGGNIYIQAAYGETSLHKLARRRVIRAERGRHGQGSAKTGRKGDDVIITVPVGTVVREISREDPAAEEALRARAAARHRRSAAAAASSSGEGAEGAEGVPSIQDERRDKFLLYPSMSAREAESTELPRLPRRDRLFAQPTAPVHLDLSRPTQRPILLAAGGIGGLGNPHFVTTGSPRPLYATKGERAVSMKIELELKLLADVGLVGLPNAGKSTLLRAISNSRARVGSWAFTTLQPNIGTVVLDNNKGRPVLNSIRRPRQRPVADDTSEPPYDDGEQQPDDTEEVERRTRFTVADIPGLIEGAHLDKGLGIAFLRHVERAGVLAFVVDLSAGNAVAALKALWNEVGLYAQMREDEEKSRARDANIDWSAANSDTTAAPPSRPALVPGQAVIADYPQAPEDGDQCGLHIAAKPWFVVATKGDKPDTQANFDELREYLSSITRGDAPHPSGVAGAWTDDCAAIPVSAINGHGVDRIVHWTVGLLDR